MKAKKISKKLELNKHTVTNLKDAEQNAIRGGLPWTSYDHIYNCYSKCNTGICCAIEEPVDTIL